jgi:hypothetical protein
MYTQIHEFYQKNIILINQKIPESIIKNAQVYLLMRYHLSKKNILYK